MANEAVNQPASKAWSGRAPGPPGTAVVGNLPDVWRRGPLEPFVDGWRRYGDVVRFRMGPEVLHLLAHPDHVEYVLASHRDNFLRGTIFEQRTRPLLGNGLLLTEGPLWEQQRRLIEPLFAVHEVPRFDEVIASSTARTLERWDARHGRDAVVDVHHEMLQLTMTVIYHAIFGMDIGAGAAEIEQTVAFFIQDISRRVNQLFNLPLFVPTPSNRRFLRERRALYSFVARSIATRRRGGEVGDDLLSRLLAARDEETGQGMSETQLRDEVLVLFGAGQETTALALTWAWYLLSQHPEVERRLHAELDTVLAGRPPTARDASNLPYTRRVLLETLRLYPPVWGFMQKAVEADEVGGFEIASNSIIVLSPYITHRHPVMWENPEIFDPDRMGPERAEGLPHYAFFPFGGGRHKCIGRELASLEAQMALATIAQRYRLRLASQDGVPVKAGLTLRPGRRVLMSLEPR